MKLKNTKKETSYERDSNGRLILSLEECEKVRAELIEQDKRSAFMGHLYRVYGRNYPDHPLHGHYSCLLYTSPSPRDVEESRMPSSA